jgi:hypothetical protein
MRIIKSCPACGLDSSDEVASLDERNLNRFKQYDFRKYDGLLSMWIDSVPPVLKRCRICGHCWYLNQPEPEQLGYMYAIAKPLTRGLYLSREATLYMRQQMRQLSKLLVRSEEPSTLLDFGSGLGRWSRAAVIEGFLVTAYEPSVERGSEVDPPFELVHSLEQLSGRKFDAVQLEQVLEHVPDPLSTLIDLRSFCKPLTVMRVTVPNLFREQGADSLWSDWPFDGEKPHFLAPFEHLHGFTPASLDRLLRRAGYISLRPVIEMRHASLNFFRQKVGVHLTKISTTLRFVTPATS